MLLLLTARLNRTASHITRSVTMRHPCGPLHHPRALCQPGSDGMELLLTQHTRSPSPALLIPPPHSPHPLTSQTQHPNGGRGNQGRKRGMELERGRGRGRGKGWGSWLEKRVGNPSPDELSCRVSQVHSGDVNRGRGRGRRRGQGEGRGEGGGSLILQSIHNRITGEHSGVG